MSPRLPEGWEMVIGLEVHAQLKTQSKLFGPAPTTFGAGPNSQLDPVSLGLPGALPVLNREAVRLAAIAGLATGCTVHLRSVFARKNYFYADLPKGYQISQFDQPICTGGGLDIDVDGAPMRVGITRIHIEEDAGKSTHTGAGSLIDLNRAGVPLIEIVGEPALQSAEQAVAYLRELRTVLLHVGVNDGNLEEGSLRCDANVSVRRAGDTALGTRCELKNLNSFRSLRDAIGYEARRQVRLLESGEVVTQQTRLWDVERQRTESMRSKEDAHDYRYVPDPDLPPLLIDAADLEAWRRALPELPASRRSRYGALGLDDETAHYLCEEPARCERFDRALGTDASPKRAQSLATFLTSRVGGSLNKAGRDWTEVDPVVEVLAAIHDDWRAGRLSNKMLAEILSTAFEADAPLAESVPAARANVGIIERDDSAIEAAIAEVLAANDAQVQAYRGGKQQLFGFFMGQAMRRLRGKANAKDVTAALRKALSA